MYEKSSSAEQLIRYAYGINVLKDEVLSHYLSTPEEHFKHTLRVCK